MLRRERDLIFKGTNRAPTYPPCSRGWVPVLETSVVGCRPARVLVFNLPIKMLGKHATALGQVAAVKECDRRRTSQRHESMGALLGLILTPPHQIPHESGKAASIGMAETFDCVHMGTQHSSAVVLEMVWKESSLLGLRVHCLEAEANRQRVDGGDELHPVVALEVRGHPVVHDDALQGEGNCF